MKLKILLLLQLIFFAVMGGWFYLNREKYIAEFWLETVPADPRDYISGTYNELRYAQESKAQECLSEIYDKKTYKYSAYLEFGPSEKKFELKDGGSGYFYEIKNCSFEKKEGKYWILTEISYRNSKIVPIFPHKFFLNENDERKKISSGKAAVKFRILKNKKLGLIDLKETKNENI
ncbi:MAG: GDYXXLXY domain-containing protein [Elusimicrobiota bacterium]